MRFTQWGQVLQNTPKTHGHVLWLLPVTTDHFIFVIYKNWGSGRPARYLGLQTRPCFAHRPDYSSVFTYGLGLTQYNRSTNIRRISGYRTLAYRASHNILVLSCLWTQLLPTCKILQINVNSSGFLHIYTRKVLQPHSKHYHQHPIYFPLCNHTWSHFGSRQSQVNTPSPIWYLHQNNADPSRFLHQYTRKVHLPHSKHYHEHPIYFPLCNTDLQVRMISITCAFVRLYLSTSSLAKHRSPTAPQIDALTRRRHTSLPLSIHEMSWQRVSRHVRSTRKSSDNTIWRQMYATQQMSHMRRERLSLQYTIKLKSTPNNQTFDTVFRPNVLKYLPTDQTLYLFMDYESKTLLINPIYKYMLSVMRLCGVSALGAGAPITLYGLKTVKKLDTNPLVFQGLFHDIQDQHFDHQFLYTVVTNFNIIKRCLPKQASIYTVELHAIQLALDVIHNSNKTKIYIDFI